MGKRSMLIAAALLSLAPPAAAQLPERAAPVAGPTPSGARLFAFDQRRGLCVGVRAPRRGLSSSCSSEAPSLREPALGIENFGATRRELVWGAVVSEVSAVEVVLSDGSRVRTETSEGSAYRGRHAGELRFFLIEVRVDRDSKPFYIRQLDEAGALLAAVEVERYEEPQRLGAVRVVGGRIGGERWTVRAYRHPRLVPLPGEPERVAQESCVALTGSLGGRSRGRFELASTCADPDGAFTQPGIAIHKACDPIGLAVLGFAEPGTRRMVAVLGDGRRLRVPLRELPGRFGGWRAFALVLGPRIALRRLLAVEATRTRVVMGPIAPGMANCPDDSGVIVIGLDFPGEPRFEPGGPALQVWDRGVLLCSTIGVPRPRLDCARPPVDAEGSRVHWHEADSGTYVAGVVAEEVRSVVLVLAGGERHVVPTTTEGPYAGRYRGLVRFFTASFPGGRTLRRTEFLGAGGEVLARVRAFGLPVIAPAPVTVLRARGGWRLGAGTLRAPGFRRRFPCVQLVHGAFSTDPFACFASAGPAVEVSCNPRTMFVYGRLRPGMRAAHVETDRGIVHARTARLPAALGVRGRVFLAAVPARARPSRLVLQGTRQRRTRLRLPAAADQCGYHHSLF